MEIRTLTGPVFDVIRDPLLLVEADGTIVACNDSARAAFDVSGGRVHTLTPRDNTWLLDVRRVAAVLTDGIPVWNQRLRDLRGRDSGITLDLARFPGGGDVWLVHLRDHRPRLEHEVWRDEMVSMVSHEIKNPLSAMQHSMDILLSEQAGELTESQRKFIQTSGRSIRRLTQLVDGVLDVSRLNAGALEIQRERADVAAFLSDTCQSFKTVFNVKHINIELDVDGVAGTAHIDEEKVGLVVANLLNNAIKFTPENGRVAVSATDIGIETLSESYRLLPWAVLGEPSLFEIRVTDDGIGMSGSDLEDLFSRFRNDAPQPGQGSGLGLNIAKRLTEAMGGWLTVDSQLGIGTEVTVALPKDARTAGLLRRLAAIRDLIEHARAREASTRVHMLYKSHQEHWDDIASSWTMTPVVNCDDAIDDGRRFHLWTINEHLAIAVVNEPEETHEVGQLLHDHAVRIEDGAYMLDGLAVGTADGPSEGASLARLVNLATRRLGAARRAVTESAREAMGSGMQSLAELWGKQS